MSKAFANPKIFAAVCLIFAGATIFNVSANASSDIKGMSLKAVPQVSAPVEEVGPTIPPNPWEHEMPPSGGGSSSRLGGVHFRLRRVPPELAFRVQGGKGLVVHPPDPTSRFPTRHFRGLFFYS